MLLRNRPGQVAAFLGVLLGGGTVVTINPSRGDDRTRADIDALQLPLVVGEPDDLATLVTPGTPSLPISGLLDDAGASATRLPARRPGERRRADADQRNDRSTQTNRPQLRHAGTQRDGPRSGQRGRTHRAATRCRDHEFAAGAYRRCVPGAAMCRRGAIVCAAGAIRAQRVGCRPSASTDHARYRWCRPPCGRCCTPTYSVPIWTASAPSPAARHRYRQTMLMPSPRSTVSRF